MHWNKRIKSMLLLSAAFIVAGCAAGTENVKPITENPSELVVQFERELTTARTNQVNLLSPTWFSRAEASLKAAQENLRQQAAIAEIAADVAKGREQLQKAEEIAAVSRTSLPETIRRRDMARKAGATALDGYSRAESDFLRLTREIEDNNLEYAMKNKQRVQESFRDLEITAIKQNMLGDVRQKLKDAESLGAKKAVPNAYAEAVSKLNAADTFISENPYEVEMMGEKAKEALFYARRAAELTRQSQKIETMSPEQIAMWLEDVFRQTTRQLGAPDMRDQSFEVQLQNITGSIRALQENQNFLISRIEEQKGEIDALNSKVITLEGKSREEQAVVERLAAEKRFNEKFLEIQSDFNRKEAEVYRQGNQLVIRLRGMQFPVGQAVIMPESYELLSKVQQAIRSFDEPDVTIEGHTDSTGSAEVNAQLSQERANAVREYLIANNTLPGNRILAIGYGPSRPLMANETAEGRAANRRIDVVIAPRVR
jgi:outer membrane protein OmpA-like peptidoglycan-associated protein